MSEAQPTNVAEVKKRHNIADFGVPFRKGFDPRRRVGSPSLGRQITSYWNLLGEEDGDGNARYSKSDLKAIIKSSGASHAKVIAAQDLLRAREDGYDKIGRIPKAADSINRIMDRTEGKPKVVMQIEHKQRSLDDVRAELLAEARKSSTFREVICNILAEPHPKLLEMIDADVIESPPILSDESRRDEQAR